MPSRRGQAGAEGVPPPLRIGQTQAWNLTGRGKFVFAGNRRFVLSLEAGGTSQKFRIEDLQVPVSKFIEKKNHRDVKTPARRVRALEAPLEALGSSTH